MVHNANGRSGAEDKLRNPLRGAHYSNAEWGLGLGGLGGLAASWGAKTALWMFLLKFDQDSMAVFNRLSDDHCLFGSEARAMQARTTAAGGYGSISGSLPSSVAIRDEG